MNSDLDIHIQMEMGFRKLRIQDPNYELANPYGISRVLVFTRPVDHMQTTPQQRKIQISPRYKHYIHPQWHSGCFLLRNFFSGVFHQN
jgi:hypothetical protein